MNVIASVQAENIARAKAAVGSCVRSDSGNIWHCVESFGETVTVVRDGDMEAYRSGLRQVCYYWHVTSFIEHTLQ